MNWLIGSKLTHDNYDDYVIKSIVTNKYMYTASDFIAFFLNEMINFHQNLHLDFLDSHCIS